LSYLMLLDVINVIKYHKDNEIYNAYGIIFS
jgi:hypothetical protein